MKLQSIIQDFFYHFLREVQEQVHIITMDMYSPYYDLARQLLFRISRLRLKQSTGLFYFQTLKSFWIAFILSNILAVL